LSALLQVHNVSKTFTSKALLRRNRHVAVREVSLELHAGEALAIVGQSGCGKSTLARMMVGLIEPDSGEIKFRGQPVRRRKASERLGTAKQLQMIFQDPFESMNPNQDVESLIARPLLLHGYKGDVRLHVLELLRKVGLTPAEDFIRKYPYQLSGGQRQRVMIARALGIEPKVMIADEPTSMLDVSIGIEIMNLLLDLKEELNLALIWITHNLASARYMADRVMVMKDGSIVESGEVDEVIGRPRHPYTRKLLNASPDPWREERDADAQDGFASETRTSMTS
jgi:peptide/nickel transport system ATP-binding protein